MSTPNATLNFINGINYDIFFSASLYNGFDYNGYGLHPFETYSLLLIASQKV